MFSKFFYRKTCFCFSCCNYHFFSWSYRSYKFTYRTISFFNPPTVKVSATYTGADAQTIASTVASPIEDAINGADNMIYMDSTSSSSGTMSLTVYFDIGTDPDQATIDVNNRISAATAKCQMQSKNLE